MSKPLPKTPKEAKTDRLRRRRDIRRGMRIALYEVNQVLARAGVRLDFGKSFVPYTVALAEGNRRDATMHDKVTAALWQRAAATGLLL